MYLIGAEHPNKDIAARRLDELITRGERLVTDAEVLQEILHRYTAIKRTEAIQPAFEVVLDLVDEVLPISIAEVDDAKTSCSVDTDCRPATPSTSPSARTHVVDRMLSFDADVDRVPGIERLS